MINDYKTALRYSEFGSTTINNFLGSKINIKFTLTVLELRFGRKNLLRDFLFFLFARWGGSMTKGEFSFYYAC